MNPSLNRWIAKRLYLDVSNDDPENKRFPAAGIGIVDSSNEIYNEKHMAKGQITWNS